MAKPEAVKNRLREAEVVVFERSISTPAIHQASLGQESCKNRHGEMIQVPWHIEVKPFIASKAGFQAAEIGNPTEKRASGAKYARNFGNCRMRVCHMLEHMPHHDGVKRLIGKMECGEFADSNG